MVRHFFCSMEIVRHILFLTASALASEVVRGHALPFWISLGVLFLVMKTFHMEKWQKWPTKNSANVFVGSKLTFLTFHRTRGPESHGKMLARFHLARGLGALNNFVPLSLLKTWDKARNRQNGNRQTHRPDRKS
jgi:hypothetical protein